MQVWFTSSSSFLVIIFFSFGLGGLIVLGSSFLAPSIDNIEKTSAYECGFEPFEDARTRFDVRFYLVALLFIVFDLEVAFLFPLVGCSVGGSAMAGVVFFLVILTFGFVYEWSQGALSWS